MSYGHWLWVTHGPGGNPYPPGSLIPHPSPTVHRFASNITVPEGEADLTDTCPHCGQSVPAPLESESDQ